MKANYTNIDRKELVKRIAEVTGSKPKYLGAPSFAYQIGKFTVTKEGTVESDDEDALELLSESISIKRIPTEEVNDTEFSITLPNISDEAMANLVTMIAAKQDLLKQALNTDNLSIVQEEDGITFPWFKNATPDELTAYMLLLTRMVEVAKSRKRITMKARETENAKYSFRCFLLGLGFIGDEYKGARKILLKNLDGSSAFKSGKKEVAE